MYSYGRRKKQPTTNPLLKQARIMTFDDYIKSFVASEAFIQQQKDWITDEYGKIIVDYVGKFESLTEDYYQILDQVGLPQKPLPGMNIDTAKSGKSYRSFYNYQTQKIIEQKYKDDIRWLSEKDAGIYDAVNKGLSLAKGDIIAYLNTDDFYFPYTVETVVDVFNSTDADIVYGDWVNLYYPSANLELLPWLKLSKYDLLSDYNLPQPTVFIRRNVFEKIGNFNLDYTLVADNEFFTRAALAGFKLVKIEEVLAGQTREHLIYASE